MKYAVCSPTTNVPLREYYVEGWCWHIYPTEQQAVQAEDAMPAFYMPPAPRRAHTQVPSSPLTLAEECS